ncbi:glycoside hydrolase family 2 TIM barrel-domain containing protein [Aestuariimicrobium sp. T2.26MG-19.2B]|uniref:glycoside hydrolase family 2 TIM barrel-domain containing protein n=1 Tax=Aestuariimicrobium sp. T2.26MG-19.2B TaxID=3040679 RepID=UPI002477437C|nr:glycoside hydrolase family 2 TIM barrel-domain containing protein [Aestuariimicrobium sp. T2.26MG-19.2B]CAI9402024.1 Beta-galactosidase BoGH2A [Aestuariimicrobium sp. T2.26MG-19.2B]
MHTLPVENWLFLLGDDPAASRKNADESAFRPVRVPHDWAVELDFDPTASSGTGYLPGGIGWYRAHVSLAQLGVAGVEHLRLVFSGVYKNADVWVNGYHLGGRPNGWVEFSFDLTEIVGYAPDDDLVIAVRVDRRDLADCRWYNGTGITRRVTLEAHGAVSVAEHGSMLTTTSTDSGVAVVDLMQTVVNHSLQPQRVVVAHTLTTAEGRTVASREHRLDLAAGERAELTSTERVGEPQLWSDEHPHLHRWTTTVTSADGVELDRRVEVVGLRTFALDPDHGFSINGEPRLLKGVCLHEDAGNLGVAVPTEVWLRRLLTLREAGCNAVRMAHNPHAPELYDLCDLLGFFVIDEAFDEWENPKNKWWQGHNVYPPKHEGYAHDYPAWHERDLVAMIEVNKLHPSVIAWSIGNEIDYPNDPYANPLFAEMTGNNDANKPAAERAYDPSRPDTRRLTTLANELIDIVRRTDPSRPVTLAAAFPELSSRTGLLDRLDLIGYNYKEHLYADDHPRFPDQPLVGSENGHGWAEWRAVVDQEFVAGQFLWTGIDYLGETHGWPSHGSPAGLMTTAGFPKERWHLRRSWWSEEPVVRLASRPIADGEDWQRPFGRDWVGTDEVEVAVFTNADSIEVTCGGEPVDLVFDETRGHHLGRAVPASGALRVVAGSGDEQLTDELVSAGAPASLRVTMWSAPDDLAPLVADVAGVSDVHQLLCEVVDDQGRPAVTGAGSGPSDPSEDHEPVVTVEVEGAELLGLDSGNLSDTTAYREPWRRTHHGRLAVYVRGAGTVRLNALDQVVTVTVGQ